MSPNEFIRILLQLIQLFYWTLQNRVLIQMRQATSAWRRNQRQTSASLFLIHKFKKTSYDPPQLHMNPLQHTPPKKNQRQKSVKQFLKLFWVWPHMNPPHTKTNKNHSPKRQWNQRQITWLHSILENVDKSLLTEHFSPFPPNHLLVYGQLGSPWPYEAVSRRVPRLVIKSFSAKVNSILSTLLTISTSVYG